MIQHDSSAPVASLLTPATPSGIAVISLQGEGADHLLSALFRPAHRGALPAESRAAYGRLVQEGRPIDEVLVLCIQAQKPPLYEICCHGGRASAEAISRALEALGAAIRPWSDRLKRGSLDHDLFTDLLRSGGGRQAALLAHLYSGGLKEAFSFIESSLHTHHPGKRKRAMAVAKDLLRSWRQGRFLHRPPRVALFGEVNAGKSTLFNAILGERRVLTSRIPGTTRDPVEASFLLDGLPIRLFDLPGLEASASLTGAAFMAKREADRCLRDADLVIHVADIRKPFPPTPDMKNAKRLMVLNKSDLCDAQEVEGAKRRNMKALAISALKNRGVDRLLEQIDLELGFEKLRERNKLLLINKKQVMLIRIAVAGFEGIGDAFRAAKEIKHYLLGKGERPRTSAGTDEL